MMLERAGGGVACMQCALVSSVAVAAVWLCVLACWRAAAPAAVIGSEGRFERAVVTP